MLSLVTFCGESILFLDERKEAGYQICKAHRCFVSEFELLSLEDVVRINTHRKKFLWLTIAYVFVLASS